MTAPLFELWVRDLRDHGADTPESSGPARRVRAEESSIAVGDIPAADLALVEQIRSGDQDAFARLFDRYYTPLCVFANRFVRDMDAAREIVSEVLYQVWVRRDGWMPRYGIAAYCFGAVRHRVQNHVRDRRTRERWTTRAAALADRPIAATPSPQPDTLAELQERASRLWAVVAELPDRQQLVITLRWQQGLSFEEIAAIAGISRGAAQMLADRALKAMRQRLEELDM